MSECRVLGVGDEHLLEDFVAIYRRGIVDLSGQSYVRPKALQSRTLQAWKDKLLPCSEKRLVAHFTSDVLDGILIEGFDAVGEEVSRTLLKWVFARYKGGGVGTSLITDCVERARFEQKDVVSLGVATQNTAARRLYEKLGFKFDGFYADKRMVLMHYFINPKLIPNI